jgi:predicted small secreted protein
MITSFKHAVAAFAFLGLAACQTTGGPSATAVNRMEAAGYEKLLAGPITAGSNTLNAAYICIKPVCGGTIVTVFARGVEDKTLVSQGQSTEAQIRSGTFSDEAARRLFAVAFRSQSPKRVVTSLRQFREPSRAGFTFAGNDVSSTGQKLYFRGRAIVRGNETDVVVSLAETDTRAQAALALAVSE